MFLQSLKLFCKDSTTCCWNFWRSNGNKTFRHCHSAPNPGERHLDCSLEVSVCVLQGCKPQHLLLFTYAWKNYSVLAGLSLSSGLHFLSCSTAPPRISPTQNGFHSLIPRRSHQVRRAAASGCGWHTDLVWAKLFFAPFHLCLIPPKGCVCIPWCCLSPKLQGFTEPSKAVQ